MHKLNSHDLSSDANNQQLVISWVSLSKYAGKMRLTLYVTLIKGGEILCKSVPRLKKNKGCASAGEQ